MRELNLDEMTQMNISLQALQLSEWITDIPYFYIHPARWALLRLGNNLFNNLFKNTMKMEFMSQHRYCMEHASKLALFFK